MKYSSSTSLCYRVFRAIIFGLVGFLAFEPTSIATARSFVPEARLSSNISNGYANHGPVVSGNTALVFSNDGTYVYVRAGSTWAQQTILVPSDGNDGCANSFKALDFEGDTAVVGCAAKSINGNANQGAVYIFVRSGTTWTEQQRLLASDGSGNDRFGTTVAISGSTVIIGALSDTVGANTAQGSAYVFVQNGSVWSEQSHLFASDGGAGHAFGRMVAINGDTAAVGRNFSQSATLANPAVYVFVRTGNTWQQQQRISVCEPSASGNCRFGYSLALDGDSLAIGNEFLNVGVNTGQGGVYLFTRSNAVWSQQQRLTAGDGASNDYLGTAVDLAGDKVIAGAPADFGVPGKAYVFRNSGGLWSFQQKLQPGGDRNGFGAKLSLDANRIVVGAALDTGDPGASIGAAYVYSEPTAVVVRSPFDFDGDGKTDIGITRPNGGVTEWWLSRSSDSNVFATVFGVTGDIPTPGDFTGDGKTDIAVFRPSNGNWFILRSEDLSFLAFPFGANGDIPMPADFDGDTKTDAAVFRPSTGTWFILRSSDGGTTIAQFGTNEDQPIAADYDGDGKADIAIYRQNGASKEWWLQRSTAGVFATVFGATGDRSVPGDYTGDGKADIAVWRPSTGNWFILRSEDFSFLAFPWGANGDSPAPGDYDGDGKFDAAVFRQSAATWFVNRTGGAGPLITNFGAATDNPVAGSFVR